MGQPTDPKRTPRSGTSRTSRPRSAIEDWLADRLARTLGDNPDEDLDDIDEIVEVDTPDDTGPQAYNSYDDEADTTRRRIAVGGAPAPPARRPTRSVGYPVIGTGSADKVAEDSHAPSHLLDPDGFVTIPSIDGPPTADEAPTVVADAAVPEQETPTFSALDEFQLPEPGPGEVTNPVPADTGSPDEWDLFGDATAATVAEEPMFGELPRFSGEETPTVAVPFDGEEANAGVLEEPSSPPPTDEELDLEAEPLDLAALEALEPSVEGVPIEVAMPAADGTLGPPANASTLEKQPNTPIFPMPSSFESRTGEDPHTTWSAVEVASGAPPPPPPPSAIAMPAPSLKTSATRTPVPPSVAPESAERPAGSWMPAPAPTLKDAETEIRITGTAASPIQLPTAPTSPRTDDPQQPTLLTRALESVPPVAAPPLVEPRVTPVPVADIRPTAHSPASPVAVPPPPPIVAMPVRPVEPLRATGTPIEAKVEVSPTEHNLTEFGGNVPMWLAAAFGLIMAVMFVAMMLAVMAWMGG